jgi:hypothetical protein
MRLDQRRPQTTQLGGNESSKTIAQTLARSRRVTVEVMLSDLDLARTFLDIAALSRDPAAALRC